MDRFASPATPPRQKKPCPFCEIAAGRADAHVVAEDAQTVAFLDHSPLLAGHVLLIPRRHVATLPEADDETLQALAAQLRALAAALPRALGADGTFVAENNVVSQSVAHLHFHVVPRWRGDKLFSHNLSWRRIRYKAGEAERIAAAIRGAHCKAEPQAVRPNDVLLAFSGRSQGEADMKLRVLIAGLVGGIAMFVWSSLAHTILPLGHTGLTAIPNEAAARTALQAAMGSEPKDGLYVFPWMEHGASASTPAPAPGASGMLVYHPDRSFEMAPSMLVSEALSEIVQAVIAAFLLSLTVLVGFLARVLFVAAIGVAVAISTHVSYWIWWGFPADFTLASIVTVIVGYLVAGVVIALILKRKAGAPAAAATV